MTPPTINAYNDPQNNTINFPAGILQLPYFSVNAERRGKLRLDRGDHRSRDDPRLRRRGPQVRRQGQPARLVDRRRCQGLRKARQTASPPNTRIRVPELGPDVKTNGKRTQGEDTADNGGVHLAMMALENLYKQRGKSLDTPDDDGTDAAPALLRQLRLRLVRERASGTGEDADHHRSALAEPLSRQYCR